MAKNYVTSFRGEKYFTPDAKHRVKEEPVTPQEEDFGDHHLLDYPFENDVKMRKSLSMNDIAALREDLMALDMQNNREDVYERYKRPTGAPHELSKTKFVSMAEAIYHYQRDTPGRFHSTRPQKFRSQGGAAPSGLTVPQSPMLRCKARSRPLYVISQKEKEEQELEEIKKHKIKANPVPKSVIEGTHLPEVPKKPITIPEPFKLTEVHKKSHESPEQIHFKARPAPKHILEKPHVPPKPPVQITKPVSPKFHYKRAKSDDQLKVDNNQASLARQKSAEKCAQKAQRHGPIRPEPFSFEKRDEQMKKRREERIKQQIEEERKQASSFKAQPLPGVVKKQMRSATSKGSASTASSENKENYIKFEARPPVVLYKEPFKPVHPPMQIVKPMPFQLTTQKRAAERERFDKLLKEKEEEQERYRKQREQELQEAEERAKAELRAKLVHHAKPVPVATKNPYIPEKSAAPLTVPETPKFVRRLKQTL
ncbi:targeting protein for Xklp2 homolog [Pectinophora gossypiella]|uniref:targeting protein for Xklp2 homolog n=1 Tax=Pectinophora gossypiella TaxID=13191 RepID=UPI00214E4BB2|nr:targeting protein for Xklp2 homolog [Pectinophora gossypiella]